MTPAEAFYAEELRWFAEADRKSMPPTSPVLFYGSSSIRLWDDLAADFQNFPVLNRGFGGSTLADCVEFAGRLVVPYRPRWIFFYAGDNDLDQHATPQEVVNRFARLVHIVRRDLGEVVPITFIAIKPSPARWSNCANIFAANRMIENFVRDEPALHFLDIVPEMLTPDGQPRTDLYHADGLHLNRAGYRLWTRLLHGNEPFLSSMA